MERDVVLKCKCDKVVEVVKHGTGYLAECKDCGSRATSKGTKSLRNLWRNKYKCSASYVASPEFIQKCKDIAKNKPIEEGSVEEFAERVSAETRKRMMIENRKMIGGDNGALVAIYSVDDKTLDEFSKVNISDSENGRHWIVKIGPKKEYHVSKTTEGIYSKNHKEQYGTLKTTDGHDWSGFYPFPKDAIWKNKGVSIPTHAIKGKREIIK